MIPIPPPSDSLFAQRHSPTSVAAAEAIRPSAATLRAKVLAAIAAGDGITDEEGIAATGMNPSTYRPRRIELVEYGYVHESMTTRPTASGRQAVVWAVKRCKCGGVLRQSREEIHPNHPELGTALHLTCEACEHFEQLEDERE